VTRTQTLVLIGLGIVTLAVLATAAFLLLRPATSEPVATLPLATAPPNPVLLTSAPLCRDIVQVDGEVWLDSQSATLEIRLENPPAGTKELPAGQIWSAFEAALAGWAQGCSGYTDLVVLAGDFRAQVTVGDLLAWESGNLDDGEFSNRVVLTK